VRKNENGSLAVALFMGAVSALLAGACVAPVVIYTLVYAQDQYARGVVIALALPFLLGAGMALPWPFAGAGLSFLPKPGAWMVRVKQVFGVFILVFALYYGHLAYGLFSDRYFVNRGAVEASAEVQEEAGWVSTIEQGLQQAKDEKKPVLLDFWATWCKNCLVMNQTTLKDPEVLKRLDGYVKIKYQAEDPNQSPVKEVWERYSLLGLPTYLVLRPEK
jgi:thiol:disulfide interchange protein